MAQNIKAINNIGLFNASADDFATITESGKEVLLNADIKDCKDPITVIVDIPASASGEYEMVCPYADSDKEVRIKLTAGKLNTIRITSYGIKKSNGTADFKMTTTNDSGFASLGVRVAFIKQVDVVNN